MLTSRQNWLLTLTEKERASFFAYLNHNLTVAMRVISYGGDASDIDLLGRIRALNEAQHAVSKYLIGLSAGEESKQWLEVTLRSIFRFTADATLMAQVNQAWDSAKVEAGLK